MLLVSKPNHMTSDPERENKNWTQGAACCMIGRECHLGRIAHLLPELTSVVAGSKCSNLVEEERDEERSVYCMGSYAEGFLSHYIG